MRHPSCRRRPHAPPTCKSLRRRPFAFILSLNAQVASTLAIDLVARQACPASSPRRLPPPSHRDEPEPLPEEPVDHLDTTTRDVHLDPDRGRGRGGGPRRSSNRCDPRSAVSRSGRPLASRWRGATCTAASSHAAGNEGDFCDDALYPTNTFSRCHARASGAGRSVRSFGASITFP